MGGDAFGLSGLHLRRPLMELRGRGLIVPVRPHNETGNSSPSTIIRPGWCSRCAEYFLLLPRYLVKLRRPCEPTSKLQAMTPTLLDPPPVFPPPNVFVCWQKRSVGKGWRGSRRPRGAVKELRISDDM
jgi:hypothetical protein